jgi:hypothetical protein
MLRPVMIWTAWFLAAVSTGAGRYRSCPPIRSLSPCAPPSLRPSRRGEISLLRRTHDGIDTTARAILVYCSQGCGRLGCRADPR